MRTFTKHPDSQVKDDEIETIFEAVLNSEDKPAAGPLPGSIEFHYRNHPHMLRMTRLRANRHGEQVRHA